MKFTVGGRQIDLTADDIRKATKGQSPEAIQKHFVSIDGRQFPPKQAFGLATGFDRGSFTTYEAQRILTKLGFHTSHAGPTADPPRGPAFGEDGDDDLPRRVQVLEDQVVTAQAAIAGLHSRLGALEA